MAGTSAVAARQALIAKIRALGLTTTEGKALQVAYSWPGRDAERECVHGGSPVTFDQNPVAFRGGGRVPRLEEVTVPICVVASKPGATVEETDVRAAAIGGLIEDAVAADPSLTGQLIIARIDRGDIDNDFNDDAAASVLTYQFILRSRLD